MAIAMDFEGEADFGAAAKELWYLLKENAPLDPFGLVSTIGRSWASRFGGYVVVAVRCRSDLGRDEYGCSNACGR